MSNLYYNFTIMIEIKLQRMINHFKSCHITFYCIVVVVALWWEYLPALYLNSFYFNCHNCWFTDLEYISGQLFSVKCYRCFFISMIMKPLFTFYYWVSVYIHIYMYVFVYFLIRICQICLSVMIFIVSKLVMLCCIIE